MPTLPPYTPTQAYASDDRAREVSRRRCVKCGKLFVGKSTTQKYCRNPCREWKRDWRKHKGRVRRKGMPPKVCIVPGCNAVFMPKSGTQVRCQEHVLKGEWEQKEQRTKLSQAKLNFELEEVAGLVSRLASEIETALAQGKDVAEWEAKFHAKRSQLARLTEAGGTRYRKEDEARISKWRSSQPPQFRAWLRTVTKDRSWLG